ncbi:uncharacterized protein RB166_018003 [Leptodactylus fuscus]|uniref:uncharacterized protein LOC142217806 n=1 Tax=Leptodactylus fuscus TaxID=238119 RepID=UPI003F4E7461
MARNEEKQQGKLNRLWLRREKEEGRVISVSGDRPRLSALHTAAEVKRWIPSIKREMEYYLEQSQLIHYSDRKIEEFQEKLEALKKEYQSHLWKLRRLDPACKEHPWKPRGYTRKRTADGKLPAWVHTGGRPSDALPSTPISDPEEDDESGPGSPGQEAAGPDLSSIQPQNQDAPLDFSIGRSHPRHVWQRSSYNTGGDTARKLKDILLSEQPELKGISAVGKSMEDRTDSQPTAGKSMVDRTDNQPAAGKSMVDRTAAEPRTGILGLDCYSSSEDED